MLLLLLLLLALSRPGWVSLQEKPAAMCSSDRQTVDVLIGP
jgi:hypothetical protein